jgi:hypothetical protein
MPRYQIQDVGTLAGFSGYSQVNPYNINNANPPAVVGTQFLGAKDNSTDSPSAFSYTQSGGIAYAYPAGKDISFGYAVNMAGDMVVCSGNSTAYGPGAPDTGSGYPYQPGVVVRGVLTPLSPIVPRLPTPYDTSYGVATSTAAAPAPIRWCGGKLNTAGDFAGVMTTGPSAATGKPNVKPGTLPILTHTQINKTVILGSLGGHNGGATAINDAGVIVGYSEPRNWNPPSTTPGWPLWTLGHAFIYRNSTMIDLNSQISSPKGEWELLWANDINEEGEIVGYGLFTQGGQQNLCAFHFVGGTVVNLDTQQKGGTSAATGINAKREIVGIALFGGDWKACIFIGGSPVELNGLIDRELRWDLWVATAINNHGQIVGWGKRRGAEGIRGFLLTPP